MRAADNYKKVLDSVATLAARCGRDIDEITVVAISKTHREEAILEVYSAGCRHFGESRLQEAAPKIENLPEDINWHLVGSLQKNKVNKAAALFSLIHSVADLALAEKISRSGGITKVLLQVNTSLEATKHGLCEEEWLPLIDSLIPLPNLQIEGLMTMAPLTDDERVIRECFSKLRKLRELLRKKSGLALPHLSMGMSNDYAIAIEEGATLLRIGSAIFR